MSSLRKPSLGPIVGHTTHESCRLWIAASNPDNAVEKESEVRRTLGVIGVVKQDNTVDPDSLAYFRLHRGHNRTGIFTLGTEIGLFKAAQGGAEAVPYRLTPATQYKVRLSTLTVDDAFDNDYDVPDKTLVGRLPHPKNWVDVLNRMPDAYVEAEFRTFSVPAANGKPKTGLSFLVGSCRYPGLLWKRKASDRVFGPMLRDHGKDIRFSLMIGDQIYADMFNKIPLCLADTYEEFQERYTTAFGSRNMREFLRHIPTYMTLDDHEIEDNWTQDRINKDRKKRVLFNIAIDAYLSYQWSHGPRSWDNCVPLPEKKKLSAVQEALHNPQTPLLYYDFLCEGYPFFVLDTRTQRFQDEQEGLHDNHLLGRPAQHPTEPGQLERLIHWLQAQQAARGNTPKFIASSSVFVPNTVISTREGFKNKEDSDSWPGFPNTRRAILDCIVEHHIQNVIFLSGDVHCSNVAKMTFNGGPSNEITAYCLTSSAFYWPFPFADGNPADYVHDSSDPKNRDTFDLSEGNGTMDYTAWGFTQCDNFCRIDIDPANQQLLFHLFDQSGSPIKTRKKSGAMNSAPQRLQLTDW